MVKSKQVLNVIDDSRTASWRLEPSPVTRPQLMRPFKFTFRFVKMTNSFPQTGRLFMLCGPMELEAPILDKAVRTMLPNTKAFY